MLCPLPALCLTALLAVLPAHLAAAAAAPPTSLSVPADAWADQYYRNWTYYPDWVIPPSCLDPDTCPGGNMMKSGPFTDIAQVWRVPGDKNWSMTYTFLDRVGYQTALATSSDLLHWDQSPGVLYSPREGRPPLEWVAQPGDFDYGGSAFVGPLLLDYNISAPRELMRHNGSYWFATFSQPLRDAVEPPPGATGLAASDDGRRWRHASRVPLLDTLPAHGAQSWEANQIYAPYLLHKDGVVYDFYNANSGRSEQTGLATLPLAQFPGVAQPGVRNSAWKRHAANPLLPNGPTCTHQAADPKVYWDARLGASGAWVMLYFGTDPSLFSGAAINVAFSLDLLTWHKATSPLYKAGGHPGGLDKCEAHKVWVTGSGRTGDDTLYMYYTADDCHGRGIALLTSKPV